MREITLSVNDREVSAVVEPRQHLADFLREQLGLTGTHVGCEQGVCGACTVMIEGKPARSCITYAVACDGAEIRTIEGFDDDLLMVELREAFSTHHALQCGFCTPAMLITSRDIVMRLGDVQERVLREELSGNLCRCTGYMGIVAAVAEVAKGKQGHPPIGDIRLDPADARRVAPSTPVPNAATPSLEDPTKHSAAEGRAGSAPGPLKSSDGWDKLELEISIDAAPHAVWQAMSDIRRVAGCLPGATIEEVEGPALRGHMSIRFGPIKAKFSGEGSIALDEDQRTGKIVGSGREVGGSQAMGEVSYGVLAGMNGTTRLQVAFRYQMTGALAQFSRGALVQDFVRRMSEIFAANLAASLGNTQTPAASHVEVDMVSMMAGVIWRRMKGLFKRR